MTQLPAQLQPYLAQAQQLHRSGQYAAAVNVYLQLAHAQPRNPMVAGLLGAAYRSMGSTAEAKRYLENAIRLDPENSQWHHDMALVHKLENHFDKAFASLDKAIKLKPGAWEYRAAKAELHYMQADVERAMSALTPALGTGVYNNAVAIIFAKISVPLKRQEEALEHVRHCLAKFDLMPTVKTKLLFAMADLLDSLGRHDEAIEAYHQANATKFPGFDAQANAGAVDRMISAWTRQAIEALPNSGIADERPILIVGMPRSGTSLVEQVLATHPQVFGGGELGFLMNAARELPSERVNALPYVVDPAAASVAELERRGRNYLGLLERMAPGKARVTDKMPLNFINLGLIQRMLPKARVIHCTRDPFDTCLSCYFQLFNGNLPFAYDLAAAGAFFRDYQRLMSHWKSVLDLPILDVAYEEMVDDQEAVSRRIVEFAGLSWDDACLQFHETKRVTLTASTLQVRQPMYKSSKRRHAKYEKHLGPLQAAMNGQSA